MKTPKGIILLSFIGLYVSILFLPRLNFLSRLNSLHNLADVREGTLPSSGSPGPSYIPGLRFEENKKAENYKKNN